VAAVAVHDDDEAVRLVRIEGFDRADYLTAPRGPPVGPRADRGG
jgi:hypothetical protein